MDKAGRIIRAVFHALRNRLSNEESFQLLSQFACVAERCVCGWRFIKNFHLIIYINDFFDKVTQEDGGLAGYDLVIIQKLGLPLPPY